MRATHRTRKPNPRLNSDFACTVLIPGADPIPWTGLAPPETLTLSRVVEPVRIEPDGRRIEPVFEEAIFTRQSIVDGVHCYEEVS